jgi:hypothetical protein
MCGLNRVIINKYLRYTPYKMFTLHWINVASYYSISDSGHTRDSAVGREPIGVVYENFRFDYNQIY